ncbi:Hypothetical Protein FCC1311_027432 [Hondaea fermentalgiana]|uniref:Uncharacterized protein n=1 Tax=Hondaea fermentalgiana TaxID=2315210 RepID=A0A2R5G638_9STRA|nr:Hypothetical Protein FCC1311_027432 [Hondaea fermentalgiana]|eukprot:GBG26522.1 Hypothetical Protein FCC1311_027432 [Hondaea fermentalgiana]
MTPRAVDAAAARKAEDPEDLVALARRLSFSACLRSESGGEDPDEDSVFVSERSGDSLLLEEEPTAEPEPQRANGDGSARRCRLRRSLHIIDTANKNKHEIDAETRTRKPANPVASTMAVRRQSAAGEAPMMMMMSTTRALTRTPPKSRRRGSSNESEEQKSQEQDGARAPSRDDMKKKAKAPAARTCERRRRPRPETRRRSLGDVPTTSTWQTRLWASLNCPELAPRENNRLEESVRHEIQRTNNAALVVKKVQLLLGEVAPAPAASQQQQKPSSGTTRAARRRAMTAPRVETNLRAIDFLQRSVDTTARFRPTAPSYDPVTPPAPLRKSIREPHNHRGSHPLSTPTPSPRSGLVVRTLAPSRELVRSDACESLAIAGTPVVPVRKSLRECNRAPFMSPADNKVRLARHLERAGSLSMSENDAHLDNLPCDGSGASFTPKPPAKPRSPSKHHGFNASVHVSRRIVRSTTN